MCRRATIRAVGCPRSSGVAVVWFGNGRGQATGWRHVGNSAIELGTELAFDGHGSGGSGLVLPGRIKIVREDGFGAGIRTADFEQWQLVADAKATPPSH